MNNIKQYISLKLLDFVECLPRFRKGFVSDLQRIRETQRKWSLREFKNRTPPENSQIELKRMALTLTFEHESFSTISKGLRRYFTKNEKIDELIKSLDESTDRLHAASWNNLGYVAREAGLYLPHVTVDESLPCDINNLSISFHRILPSVACVIFIFELEDTVSRQIDKILQQQFLNTVTLKKWWPIRHIGKGYTMSSSDVNAKNAFRQKKGLIRDQIETWIKKSFGWHPASIGSLSYVDFHNIIGNPTEDAERNSWMSENLGWLDLYGISHRGFNSYEGKGFLLTYDDSEDKNVYSSDVIAQFETEKESEHGDHMHYKIEALALSKTLFGVINGYRLKVEALRGSGYKTLYSGQRMTKKNQACILEIKKIIVLLERLEHELAQGAHWVSHSISEMGELKDLSNDKPVKLGEATLSNLKYQLKQVKGATNIINDGLTNYLESQNIFAMYRLQMWMLILSLVVTVATITGVISNWNDIKNTLTNLAEQLRDS